MDLAGEADADFQWGAAVVGLFEAGVVKTAALSHANACGVDADEWDDDGVQLVGAQALAGVVARADGACLQVACAAGAVRFVGGVGDKPHAPLVFFDVGQIQVYAALAGGRDQTVQPQFAACWQVHGKALAAFEKGLQVA